MIRYISLRVTPEFHDRLQREAADNLRKLQTECIVMLEESLARRQRNRRRAARAGVVRDDGSSAPAA